MTNTNPPEPATAEPTPAPPPPAERPRKDKAPSRWGGCLPWAAILFVLLAILLIWKFPSLKAQAELGSAYAARVGCSCRYVQGRTLESCQSDFEPGMEMVSISQDPETKTITGSVPLLASRSAHYAGSSGCLLDPP
ncbi:hypothetical protein [Sphingopyxis indica]|uniref:Uncharacterized protein n=1 Tax=Sphingopyxis indica TaxID=436663 RepID=A0A239LC83_9SPHN|nr:hypothetical protein [Sphingopyxis indica]SNT28246.1 hypothetical protein SAMN06295955_12211 [Sphingopyxis indica]